jgi:hypothetical protein
MKTGVFSRTLSTLRRHFQFSELFKINNIFFSVKYTFINYLVISDAVSAEYVM